MQSYKKFLTFARGRQEKIVNDVLKITFGAF